MRNNEEGKENEDGTIPDKIHVDFDTDWCIKIDNYVIDPMFYKSITKSDINSPGINIICNNIILNGKTIGTPFMKSKDPQEQGNFHLPSWRCNVFVKSLKYVLSEADKYKTMITYVTKYIIGKMHCNIHIAGSNLIYKLKPGATKENGFQANNLPITINDDYELDDGTSIMGIDNYTGEELSIGWRKQLPRTKKIKEVKSITKKHIIKEKKSVVEKKISKTKKTKGILYIVSYHELDLMAKELGYKHLNKCGYSENTEEELYRRYQKQSLKRITLTIISKNVINPREVETHMWFKQPQMIENKLAERLKEHTNKEDYVCTGKELFTLDVDTLKKKAEQAIRGMEHNMSETDEDVIAETNDDDKKKSEYPSHQQELFSVRTIK